MQDDPDKVEILLEMGAKVDLEDKWGNIPLNRIRSQGFQLKIADLLLKFHSKTEHVNLYGSSPVGLAHDCSDTMREFTSLYEKHRTMTDWSILLDSDAAFSKRKEINDGTFR